MSMTTQDFDFLSEIVKKRSGLALTPDKAYLFEARLQPVARGRGFQTMEEMIASLRRQPVEAILAEITEAMTTNESSFFRDTKPYEQLRQLVLPHVRASMAPGERLRIWSAASSTGQEPYSIAITLMEEAPKLGGMVWEMLGTDIAGKVLDKAREGLFTQFEVQRGLPIQMLLKYFEQRPENHWQIKEELRKAIQFRLQNLLEDFTALGQFHLIFCRNVLIYFDEPTKAKVLERMARCLKPGGALYLGSTETIIGITNAFKPFGQERGIFVPA